MVRDFLFLLFSFVLKKFFMNHLPFYIPLVFILTTFITIYLFYKASGRNIKFLIVAAVWIMIQSALTATGFFTVTDTLPPRFLLLIVFPLIGMLTMFSTTKGKLFMDRFNTGNLTLLHSIRVPVEMVLFLLFLHKAMPQLMTFEGRNFDLISGVTAPLIYYFGYSKKKLGTKILLTWNVICLLILLFTVTNAILSAPTPFQKFGFDQPSAAIFYFPFAWLPGVLVPLVIFSHLITIRFLLREVKQKNISPLTLTIKQVA
jgi:hypothetical protein